MTYLNVMFLGIIIGSGIFFSLLSQKIDVPGEIVQIPKTAAIKMDCGLSQGSFLGESVFDESGRSVAGAGDVNGDGYDDFLIGAYNNSESGTNAGKTYLVFGKALGWSTDVNLSNVDASFLGEYAQDESGRSVAGAGDVNGDGYDDILIGAYLNDESFSQAGQTYLIFGKPNGWEKNTNLNTANASFLGEGSSDYSGFAVAGAGDVNNDSFDDIIIGAYRNDEAGLYAGKVYLIFGNASGWSMGMSLSNANASFRGEGQSDLAGIRVAGAGDVNGDDYDDVIIGAWGNDDAGADNGKTYLIFGKATGWSRDVSLYSANASFLGEYAHDEAGTSVAGLGDFNGDGYDDIAIGAQKNDESAYGAGQTYLIFGKSSNWLNNVSLSTVDASFLGESLDDYSGYSVARAGDINNDGYNDILIGAFNNSESDSNAGKTYLIYGKATGWTMDMSLSNADASFQGESANDRSSMSIAGAGDVNGDGYDDIVIGAYLNDESAENAGQTYLILYPVDQIPTTFIPGYSSIIIITNVIAITSIIYLNIRKKYSLND